MKIQKNILLAPYTTFKIGGEAKFFGVVENIEDLEKGVNFALQNSLSLFILGGGSNLLISDKGFDGLVLKIEMKDISFVKEDNNIEIIAGAGVILDDLIIEIVNRKLIGLENLSFIPGTVGAGVVQNTGAFGTEIGDTVDWVEVFDTTTKDIFKLNNKECKFKYRNSIFKQNQNWIIINVSFKLKIKGKLNFSYANLKELKDKKDITSKDIREAIISIRKKGTPWVDGFGSAGCFFKNPVIADKELVKIKQIFPEIPVFKEEGKNKISAGWLLDKLGWKGYSKNNVGVYNKHALMLINKGNGTCEEIKNLAQKISDDVLKRTGIKLEKEVVFV